MAYKIIAPPFTLKFWEMSKKELREYFEWFQEIMPERVMEPQSAVDSSDGFENWRADHTPSSLDALGIWFTSQVETRLKTQEELASADPWFPTSKRQLTDRTISLAVDIAMYLSLVLLRNNTQLRWDQPLRAKSDINYGQPVLAGFADQIPVNPMRVLTSLAYGLADGARTPGRLREIYDQLSKTAMDGQ